MGSLCHSLDLQARIVCLAGPVGGDDIQHIDVVQTSPSANDRQNLAAYNDAASRCWARQVDARIRAFGMAGLIPFECLKLAKHISNTAQT